MKKFIIALIGGVVAYLALIRPQVVRWGATDDELQRKWPGDDFAPKSKFVSTQAITIHAPPSAIWPWLVQIGNGRAGWYSYRWLEYMVRDGKLLYEGASHRIVPELQSLKVGDPIPVGDEAFTVVAMQPNEYLTLRLGAEELSGEGAGHTFILDPVNDQTTRLIARARIASGSLLSVLVTVFFFEPGHCIMQTKMLHGIKERVERRKG